jgi:hypothetical protein
MITYYVTQVFPLTGHEPAVEQPAQITFSEAQARAVCPICLGPALFGTCAMWCAQCGFINNP